MKPFTLLPTKNYRRLRLHTCANCRHLTHTDDPGAFYRCKRPIRSKNSVSPIYQSWELHRAYQCTCDRWVKKG